MGKNLSKTFQFGLRALFGFTTVLAVGICVQGYWRDQDYLGRLLLTTLVVYVALCFSAAAYLTRSS